MNIKKKFGFLFLILSIIFLSSLFNFNVTGNIVKNYFWSDFSFLNFIEMVLFFLSLFLLTSRKSLDAIIIPTGGGSERTKKSLEAYGKRDVGYFVISGKLEGGESLNKSQRADIYRDLRKYGIKPKEIKVEGKSSDTLENAIYSLENLRENERVGIVSYPKHLERFRYIVEKMREEGKISKGVKIEYIPTDQTFKQWAYGMVANIKERGRLREGISEARKQKTSHFGNFFKNIINRP
jgi:vancomycin permeability regulator SanA